MEDYSKLNNRQKRDMLWPIGTQIKRTGSTVAGTITQGEIYTLLEDKEIERCTVIILGDSGKRTNRDSDFFELISLPNNEQFPIY